MASYRVQLWSSSSSDFSPSALLMEFENPKNLGYGSYLNDIGEAFFTVNQYDIKANVRIHEGKAHVVIIRSDRGNTDVVWRGMLAEHDANENDVIFYAYGYEHFLHSLHSQWKKKWKSVKVAGATGRPVNDMWDRAQTLANSPVQWVTDGTIQAPYVDNAKTTELTLNRYRVNWKPILTIFKELVAIATSDTNNICYFEIDYPTDPTDLSASFNFYKDNTSDITTLRLEYPNNILDWSDRYVPVLFRNKTLGVGSGPRNQLYRFQKTFDSGDFGTSLFGLHSQNMYLSWVRDRAELKRVVRRRTRLALREDTNAWVRCLPDSIAPWRATASSHEPGDRIRVSIQHGATQIDKWMLLMGEQVVFVNGREYVQPMLEDRADSPVESSFSGFTWHGPTSSTMWTVAGPTSAGSVTQSITLDSGDRVVAVPIMANAVKISTGGAALITSVTLGGTAGTLHALEGGTGGGDRTVMAYTWEGSAVPYGQTVDLVINYASNAFTLGFVYGLAAAGTDKVDGEPILWQTDIGSAASGSASFSFSTGATAAIGLGYAWHTSTSYSPDTGNEALIDDFPFTGAYFSVWSTTASGTGTVVVGGAGNQNHSAGALLWENS